MSNAAIIAVAVAVAVVLAVVLAVALDANRAAVGIAHSRAGELRVPGDFDPGPGDGA
jgi:hypothetical protein